MTNPTDFFIRSENFLAELRLIESEIVNQIISDVTELSQKVQFVSSKDAYGRAARYSMEGFQQLNDRLKVYSSDKFCSPLAEGFLRTEQPYFESPLRLTKQLKAILLRTLN